MSFRDMMDRMKKKDAIKSIVNKVQSNYVSDPRFWSPTFAKNKDGREESKAIVRFLPAPDGETEDFAKFYTHFIRGQGNKKYIERCRTTLGEADPAEELAKRLGGGNKDVYLKYGRTPRFVANVLVIQDGNKPENNGRVFLLEFGNKIMKKITAVMNGSDDPIDPREPVNVLDPLEGANFKLVVTKQGGQNNYDESQFMGQSSLFNGDLDKIEAAWKTAHKLKPLIAADTFKSYDELARHLADVVGDDLVQSKAATSGKAPAKTSPRAAKAESPREDDLSDDPDKIFEDLVSGTEALSSDDAVDAMFNE
jgi:hypothetical protein